VVVVSAALFSAVVVAAALVSVALVSEIITVARVELSETTGTE